MGNQTSQLFALYYLDPLDRLVKERLRVKRYTRYMDDMVLLHKLRTSAKNRLKKRLKGLQKGYAEGRLNFDDVNRSLAATHEHLIHGHTYRLRAKVYSETVFTRKDEDE
ncbi:MAG: hypothetical protein LBS00_12545 [Synergistaceae bacterium]|jgi:hypothetical protein|nr:hypothetical protein [Synergistaceae bacterium]